MRNRVVKDLIYAQLSFFICLAIAILITTAGFWDNHGLSFYGEHLRTAVPFGAGFVLCDFFMLRAAETLPKNQAPYHRLTILLKILAVMVLLIVLTPDTVDSFFNWSHLVASSGLFLFELSFAIWLAVRCYSDKLVWLLLAVQFCAGLVAMLSQLHKIYYLSEGILFFQLFFGLLLIRCVSKMLERPAAAHAEQSEHV